MSSPKKRRPYSPEEKLQILKRFSIGKESVSDICEDLNLHPTQFYRWQTELFKHGSSVFESHKSKKLESKALKRLEIEKAHLLKIVDKKDTVIAEITEDYVRLKKKSGDLLRNDGLNQM